MIFAGDEELAAILGSAYAEVGFSGAVRKMMHKKLERLKGKSEKGQYVPAILYARIRLRLGDQGEAFRWLEKAAGERNAYALMLKSDPF